MPPCRQTSVAPRSPGLDRAVHHLVDVEDVRVAAQVEALGPAREAAEAAAEVALVGVVDVAVDHVGDRVAAGALAQRVGHARDRLDLGAAGAEEALDLGHPRRRALERALEDAGQLGRQPRQALVGRALAPGGVLPFGRQARAPGPAAPRRAPEPRCSAGATTPEPSIWFSQAVKSGRASASRASSISVSGGSAVRSTSGRGAMASRRAPTCSGVQSPTTRSPAPAGDGVEGALERVDLHRDPGRDPRQPAQLDGLLQTGVVGAQEGRAGAGQRVEDDGPRAVVAHRDAPARHALGEQLHRDVGGDHPGDRRAVGDGGLDRQQPGLERARHGGVGELAALLDPGPDRRAGGQRAAEGDAHAATAAIGWGDPARASPSSSAIARTCARRPGSRKSSSARNSG